MDINYDPTKRASNIQKHGLDFADVEFLDWDNAMVIPDTRKDYGENRYRAFIYDDFGRGPYSVAFTMNNDVMRVISFRRAHAKERKIYAQETE